MFKLLLRNTSTSDKVQTETGYSTVGSAGFDIAANESKEIWPFSCAIVSTGLFLDGIEDLNGFLRANNLKPMLDIRPRSGLSTKMITVLNAPGLIDIDYPDEIKVILGNMSPNTYTVNVGDRIAQGVASVSFSTNMPTKGAVRTGGFGSTGV